MLKLKEGFEVYDGSDTQGAFITPTGGNHRNALAFIHHDGKEPANGRVHAFPHGEWEYQGFETEQEAHEYLLSVGSESPWEEVPPAPDTLTRLITAAQNVEFSLAGFTVSSGCNSIGEYYAEVEGLNVYTGSHPSLNAALEALLDCKVGAVTVAQILGVA